MSLLEELKELGVDVDEGMQRVLGDEPLYETMLGMFVDQVNSNSIAAEDFDAKNLDDLIKRVHALKGLTGNLAMTRLFEGYQQALNLLRANRAGEALKVIEGILPVQTAIMDCIKRHGSV